MAFTVDTNNVQENNNRGVMKPGEYEMVIKEVKEGATQSGTAYIQIELVVRNDVDQEYKNKHVWYSIWDTQKTRESGMYARNINTISKHAGIQNGATFNGIEEWGKFLFGKAIRVTIKNDEYNGKTREQVSYINASNFQQCNHSWATNNVAGNGQAWQGNQSTNNQQAGYQNNNSQQVQNPIDDYDLPF